MNGLCAQKISIYYCPSDSGNPDQNVGTYQRCRGNYVVNWGRNWYPGSSTATAAPPGGRAPYWHETGKVRVPGVTRMASITDGTSNTLLLSEYLMARSPNDNDWRGDIHNDDGVFRFHTRNLTPNASASDRILNGWFQVPNDPLIPAVAATDQENAARSRHTGGVNAALCDGSIRFYRNSIALVTWQGLGTMDGNEVIAND
jgi:prepilin-type processing-associated H-X9-DG protein